MKVVFLALAQPWQRLSCWGAERRENKVNEMENYGQLESLFLYAPPCWFRFQTARATCGGNQVFLFRRQLRKRETSMDCVANYPEPETRR